MRLTHAFFLSTAGLVLLSLSGCGTRPSAADPVPSLASSAAPAISGSPVPVSPGKAASSLRASAPSLILEPGAGVQPWVTLIDQARTGIDVNAYLIDNSAILTALRQAGARGVPIHVLLAPNPYDDTAAVPGERQALDQVPDSTVRNAPPRFDEAYAFDHAKYLVINPGTAHVAAIIGSPNFRCL